MSEPVYNDEATLAEALRRCGVEVGSVGGDHFRRVVANRLLGSSWLAAHDAEVAARALREAADTLDIANAWAELDIPDWLRARADRVAGHTPQERA